MVKLGFIGSGKMAFALAKSFVDSKAVLIDDIIMSDVDEATLGVVSKYFKTTTENKEVLFADIVFICVKPDGVLNVLKEIKNEVDNQIIVSVAASITIESMETILPNKKIARLMPNVLCQFKDMSSAYSYNDACTKEDIGVLHDLFNEIGFSVKIEEDKMDVVTVLSGSSPAFFAQFFDIFIDESVKRGLGREDSKQLLRRVFIGLGKYLENNEPQDLINEVTSSKGVTRAGLQEMSDKNIKQGIEDVFKASLKRCEELNKKILSHEENSFK